MSSVKWLTFFLNCYFISKRVNSHKWYLKQVTLAPWVYFSVVRSGSVMLVIVGALLFPQPTSGFSHGRGGEHSPPVSLHAQCFPPLGFFKSLEPSPGVSSAQKYWWVNTPGAIPNPWRQQLVSNCSPLFLHHHLKRRSVCFSKVLVKLGPYCLLQKPQ